MERIKYIILIIIITQLAPLCFLAAFPTALSEGISDSTGRTLLQIPKACPISFEFKNYTIITSQCQGPHYPPKQCCDAFEQFACPFAPYLNNFTECSKSMFDYLNLRAHYPTGLFSSLCKGDREGLPCLASPPVSQPVANSDLGGSVSKCKTSRLPLVTTAFVVFLLVMLFI